MAPRQPRDPSKIVVPPRQKRNFILWYIESTPVQQIAATIGGNAAGTIQALAVANSWAAFRNVVDSGFGIGTRTKFLATFDDHVTNADRGDPFCFYCDEWYEDWWLHVQVCPYSRWEGGEQ